ncbi:ABC transporter ATP-binding protein [Onishia taeanensis]
MHTLRRIFPLLWESSRRWTLLSTLLMILEVTFGLAMLYLLKQLADVVTGLLDGEAASADIAPVMWYVALTGIAALAFMISRSLSNLAKEACGLLVADHIDRQIHARAVTADLAFFESPRYFDTLERAREAGNQRPVQVVGNLMMLAKNCLMLTALMAMILTIHGLLLPVLLVAVIPALLVRLRFTRQLYDWQRRRTQMERRASYLDWLMTSDCHAKELRLFHMGDYLKERYADLRAQIRRERMHITRRRTGLEVAVSSMATIAFFATLAFLAWQTAGGKNSLGDLVLFMLVFQRAQTMGQEVVHQLSKLYEDHLYMGLLFEFLDIRQSIVDPAQPMPISATPGEGLRFEKVSFRYPDTEPLALHHIDLSIRPGQVVALVGANGCGKTSLIKLLCRLYDPTAGRITLDGVDIRDFNVEEYRQQFSVIFQDYSHYADTVHENIRFGDLQQPIDTPSVKTAAFQADADPFIQQLSAGYATPLTRMFDGGQEISVGQWQKIALARAFLHPSRLIILDEPTSALDPGAEFELFENFRERIDHRAALVISHRLSTVRMADYIYVMDQGRICESGTHDDLIRQGGVYSELFLKQAHFYRGVEA